MATRLEKVVLDIESNLAPVMTRDAAAAALLKRELNSLSTNAVRGTSRDVDTLGTSANKTGREIDRFSGRLRLLADTAAIHGPALIPIGAVGIPALTGLAAQFGAAALAGGTAIIAFQGVGTALEAVNKAALEPTTANLEAARIAMGRLGPEAQSFVRELHNLMPALEGVRNAAAAGLFPGLEKSLGDMESLLPRVEQIVYQIGHTLGELAADSAESLAGPRWEEFIAFVGDEVPRALAQMGRTVGSLAHGLAELWMAFDPLNDSFTGWLEDAAAGFDKWAQGLSRTDGFQEFVDYIRANGPKVADALGSIGNALLQIVEAAAPLGGPVLDALAAVADVIAKIAGSDAGPAIMATVTALALLSRGMRAFDAVAATSWGKAVKGADTLTGKLAASRGVMLKSSAALAGVAVASSDVADGFGLSNTMSLALLGTLGGPWGAAVGGAVGLLLDATAATGGFEVSTDELIGTLDQQTGAITANTTAWAANQLEKNGTLKAAQELGLNLEDVTQAALGDADAMERVAAGLREADSELRNANGDLIVGTEVWTAFADNTYAVEKGIGGVKDGLGTAQGMFQRVSSATGRTSESFRQAASSADLFRNAMDRVNALLDKRASFRDYEQALDDFAKALKGVKDKAKLLNDNGTINITIPKGRELQAALDNIANTALRVADNLKGVDRLRYMQQARRDFIAAAEDMKVPHGMAVKLADAIFNIPQQRKIAVSADVREAIRGIISVRDYLASVNSKTVTLTVHTQRTGGDGVDFASGGQRPAAPRSTTSGRVTTSAPLGRLGAADTHARSIQAASGLTAVAKAAYTATVEIDKMRDETEREGESRQRLLERELRHAEKKMQEELEYLRELRDARRSLVAETAGNFMSGLFGGDGLVNWQHLLGSLTNEGISAESFQSALQQLSALGLDGGLFAELAASGNLAWAQELAGLTPQQIQQLEDAFELRNEAAQSVGQFAGAEVWGEAIKDQTREVRQARRATERLEDRLRAVEREQRRTTRAAGETGPDRTARKVGAVINGAAANAARKAHK